MSPSQGNSSQEPFLPPSLGQELRSRFGKCPVVPPEVQRRIREEARRYFAVRFRRMRLRRAVAATLAVAASLLLAFFLLRPTGGLRGDIDRNGTVNIVDALLLARRIASGDALAKAWDLNSDGAVDRHDVDAVAMSAVSLDQRGKG